MKEGFLTMVSNEKKEIYKAVLETLKGKKTYEDSDLLKLVKLIESESSETKDKTISVTKARKK